MMCKGSSQQKRIWIAWERQRRTLELAKSFNCKLFLIIEKGILRYAICAVKTFLILRKERPDVLFVQNPSIVLAFLSVSIFRFFFRYKIVVDRHSNFLLTPQKRSFAFEAFFHFLSFVTIKLADLTIVTNPQLASVIDVLGGRGRVLPDKIPVLVPSNLKQLSGNKNILVVSSFANDEPIMEIVGAAKQLEPEGFVFYFSGNYNKYRDPEVLIKQENIKLPGFIPDQDFIDLLFAVDIVLVLTRMEYTLLCGCYEAIAADKVLITSNTLVLKSLFDGAVFVSNDIESIVNGIQYAFQNRIQLSKEIKVLRQNMSKLWRIQFDAICKEILNVKENS